MAQRELMKPSPYRHAKTVMDSSGEQGRCGHMAHWAGERAACSSMSLWIPGSAKSLEREHVSSGVEGQGFPREQTFPTVPFVGQEDQMFKLEVYNNLLAQLTCPIENTQAKREFSVSTKVVGQVMGRGSWEDPTRSGRREDCANGCSLHCCG